VTPLWPAILDGSVQELPSPGSLDRDEERHLIAIRLPGDRFRAIAFRPTEAIQAMTHDSLEFGPPFCGGYAGCALGIAARCQLSWPVGVNYPDRWKRGMFGLAFRL
jgi:hypothetical protein